jgi:hypothetical protein
MIGSVQEYQKEWAQATEAERAYIKAMCMGFYITQRGEGRIWFLHAPDGRTVLMAATREDLLEKIPSQFE